MKAGTDTGQDTSNMYANASATLGGCVGLSVPEGWEGVASTTVIPLLMVYGMLRRD